MYGMKYPIGTKETLTHGSNYQSSFGLLLLCSNAFVLEKLFQKKSHKHKPEKTLWIDYIQLAIPQGKQFRY